MKKHFGDIRFVSLFAESHMAIATISHRATQACTTTSGERMPFYVIGLISIRRGNSLLTVCNMLSILNRWGIGCKATIFGQQTIPLLGKKLKGLFMEFSEVTCIPWEFSDSVKAGMGKWAQPNILRLVSLTHRIIKLFLSLGNCECDMFGITLRQLKKKSKPIILPRRDVLF